MDKIKNILNKPSHVILIIVAVVALVLAGLTYRLVSASPAQNVTAQNPTPTLPTPTPTPKPKPNVKAAPTPKPVILPVQDRSKVLGVEGESGTNFQGIPWVRLAHPTCGWGNLQGATLASTIQAYHRKGIRVLFTICQSAGSSLLDPAKFIDAAHAYPDAVQCGNEQMKQDSSVSFLYVPPARFARFYDLCEKAIHQVNPQTPVLLGSLDPHVANADYQLLENQVSYLDDMQSAMNSTVHPGGNWKWRNQTLGLIDSWHNGWNGDNNLQDLFQFWSQQFQVGMGDIGKHLWVVEGTGCFKGCGINVDSPSDVAVSHILALTTDVQTVQQYKVPFFYFSGKDFHDQGIDWPIGILDKNGHSKPIRQDLQMGAVTFTMACGKQRVAVKDQLQLLARMYQHCALPGNYVAVLSGQ